MRIGKIELARNSLPLVIAEVAQAHDGSLGTAHAFIDAAANAGCGAVKFQTHIADAESTAADRFRVPFSRQDASRYDYWKRMEFTSEQWAGLKQHATDRGIEFLSTPFSIAAVRLLERLEVVAWKVGSGDINSLDLLTVLSQTGKPILLSSGMSSWTDLDSAVNLLRSFDSEFAVLQCTSCYPCPPEKWGLNIISDIERRYGCVAGYSDHSGTLASGLAAIALGAKILEVHVTFSKHAFGPDVSSSLTIEELSALVQGSKAIGKALLNPVDKTGQAQELAELRLLFGKSAVAIRDIEAGSRISPEDFLFKKPGNGIPAKAFVEFVGQKLRRTVKEGQMLKPEDICGAQDFERTNWND